MDDQQYTPAQVAEILDVGATAVRKYSLLLEQYGHEIKRNNKGYRVYSGHDVALLKALLVLNRDKSMTLDDAASRVTSSDVDIAAIIGFNDDTHSAMQNAVSAVMTTQPPSVAGDIAAYEAAVALIEQLQQQVELSNTLHTKFMAAIDEKLEEQHNVIALQNEEMALQSEQLKRQAEILEEQAKQIEELKQLQKRSFWAKLFGK